VNIELYDHDDGFRVVATNAHGGSAETVIPSDDPVAEYVRRKGRLQSSYLVYWLTETGNDDEFLAFLNNANDHFRPRRVRQPGWDQHLSTGEVPSKPQKPGDVVVHGNHARAVVRGSD
jgi:hypothetical protein